MVVLHLGHVTFIAEPAHIRQNSYSDFRFSPSTDVSDLNLKSDKMSVIVHMSDTGLRPGDEVRVAAFDVERL